MANSTCDSKCIKGVQIFDRNFYHKIIAGECDQSLNFNINDAFKTYTTSIDTSINCQEQKISIDDTIEQNILVYYLYHAFKFIEFIKEEAPEGENNKYNLINKYNKKQVLDKSGGKNPLLIDDNVENILLTSNYIFNETIISNNDVKLLKNSLTNDMIKNIQNNLSQSSVTKSGGSNNFSLKPSKEYKKGKSKSKGVEESLSAKKVRKTKTIKNTSRNTV